MSDQTDILTRTLARFGLTTEEAGIYLCLLETGAKSALELSRNLHMARTRVYRLLDKLGERGLVTQKFASLGLKFTASPYKQLELLLAERQSELESIKAALPALYAQLGMMSVQTAGSKVLYHHGVDGLKHVTWNSLRARGKLLIYEVSASMTAFLPQEFSEKVREELVTNKIHTLQLTNIAHMSPWTKVKDAAGTYWTPRFIAPKELLIKSEVLIYNDVTAIYHYLNNDIFCVEIVNADLAHMQSQIFDFIFRHATPMKKIGTYGEAKIVQ